MIREHEPHFGESIEQRDEREDAALAEDLIGFEPLRDAARRPTPHDFPVAPEAGAASTTNQQRDFPGHRPPYKRTYRRTT